MSRSIPIAASSPPYAVSTSPTASTSFHERYAAHRRDTVSNPLGGLRAPKVLHPVENEDLRLLLLENISQDAVKAFRSQGFHVDHNTKAMSEDELVEKIGSYHAIGIRSKTKITARVLKAASKVRPFPPIQYYNYQRKSIYHSFLLLDAFVSASTKLTCTKRPRSASQFSIRHSPIRAR
jgi:hypothetical protein